LTVATRRPQAKDPPSDERDEFWESLHGVYSLITEHLGGTLAPFGLAIVEYRALRICLDGPARATDLTRRLGLTPSGTTELIDRLERRRLVKRAENPADRRSVLVGLTAGGHRLVTAARDARRAELHRFARSMPPERRKRLKSDLDELLVAAQETLRT